jgi:iron complex outermembrane receptor protein
MAKIIRPLFLAFIPFGVAAQSDSDSSRINGSNIPQSLTPVEVRSIRAGSDAPFAKTDIGGKALQKDNLGQDLPILLQYTPSVVVSSDAGNGVGYTGIRIRGTDATRINTTLNGIAINDAESSGPFFINMPDLASSTTSIQIQRGVGTSTNGSGAFGGTISVANLGLGEVPTASAAVSYGSFNTQKYTVSAETGMLGKVAFGLRLSRIMSDGFVDRSSSLLSALQLQGLYRVSEKTSIKFLIMQGSERTDQAWNGVPEEKLRGSDSALAAHYANNVGSLYYGPRDSANLFGANPRKYNSFLYGNQTDNYRQNFYQLFADHRFNSRLSAHLGVFLTRGIGYYEEYKPDEKYSTYGLAPYVPSAGDTFQRTPLVRQLWLDNYNYGTVFSLQYDAAKNTKLSFGGGWSQYAGRHYGFVKSAEAGGIPVDYRWYNLNAQKNDFNLYAKGEQRIGTRLSLYGDLQVRTIGYFMNGFRKNQDLHPAVTYTFFNPKAGFSYRMPAAGGSQRVYGSVAVANKEPNRDDFEAGVNSQPRPERLIDGEAGYEFGSKHWSFGANAYYMDYKDQLVLTGKVNDVGGYTRVNVPNSYRAGLELQAGWAPARWIAINANATYSQNKIRNFVEYVDNYDDGSQAAIDHGTTDIAFAPSMIGAGGVTFTPWATHFTGPKGLAFELLGKYVGRQYLDNTGNDARSIDPYGLCDFRVRYNVALKPFKELGVSLLVNNLLDRKYENNGYTYSYIAGGATTTQNFFFPQAGINWLLGVNMKW